jgi:hypothetical protein
MFNMIPIIQLYRIYWSPSNIFRRILRSILKLRWLISHTYYLSSALFLFFSLSLFFFFLFLNIVFWPAANGRFPKRNHYDGFVMRNCRDLCAFDSRHVRRNCVRGWGIFQIHYSAISRITAAACLQSVTIYTEIGNNAVAISDRAIFVIKAAKAIIHCTRKHGQVLRSPDNRRPIRIARRHEIRF